MLPYKSYKNFLFDLDGTLIDSKISIIDSLSYAFNHFNKTINLSKEDDIIGPPLDEVLSFLDSTNDKELQKELKKIFMLRYDSHEYLKTKVANGVEPILRNLSELNKNILIVTNKRSIPTKKIIKMFECFKVVSQCYSIDTFKKINKKKFILKEVLNINKLKKNETIYIGDTHGDYLAAQFNNIDFLRVVINSSGSIEVVNKNF
jgi:phosphoglycolate phosphatase